MKRQWTIALSGPFAGAVLAILVARLIGALAGESFSAWTLKGVGIGGALLGFSIGVALVAA